MVGGMCLGDVISPPVPWLGLHPCSYSPPGRLQSGCVPSRKRNGLAKTRPASATRTFSSLSVRSRKSRDGSLVKGACEQGLATQGWSHMQRGRAPGAQDRRRAAGGGGTDGCKRHLSTEPSARGVHWLWCWETQVQGSVTEGAMALCSEHCLWPRLPAPHACWALALCPGPQLSPLPGASPALHVPTLWLGAGHRAQIPMKRQKLWLLKGLTPTLHLASELRHLPVPEKPGPVAVGGVHGLGPRTRMFLPVFKAVGHRGAQAGTGRTRMQPKTCLLGELAPTSALGSFHTHPSPAHCWTPCARLAGGRALEAGEPLHENSK